MREGYFKLEAVCKLLAKVPHIEDNADFRLKREVIGAIDCMPATWRYSASSFAFSN